MIIMFCRNISKVPLCWQILWASGVQIFHSRLKSRSFYPLQFSSSFFTAQSIDLEISLSFFLSLLALATHEHPARHPLQTFAEARKLYHSSGQRAELDAKLYQLLRIFDLDNPEKSLLETRMISVQNSSYFVLFHQRSEVRRVQCEHRFSRLTILDWVVLVIGAADSPQI